MTIVITGWRSRISEEFRRILFPAEVAVHGKPMDSNDPPEAERFFFCQGLLRSKSINDQTASEIAEGRQVNFLSIVRWIDALVARQKPVRICVMGSESGYRGSYDEVYAESKALLHRYIETKELFPHQQLVGISPGIIEDAAMTLRRQDVERLDRRRLEHPMRRFLASEEVARMAKTLLYNQPYVSGTMIRMHGGEK